MNILPLTFYCYSENLMPVKFYLPSETWFILVIDGCGFRCHPVTLLNVIFDTGMHSFYLHIINTAFLLWNEKNMPFDPIYYSSLDEEISSKVWSSGRLILFTENLLFCQIIFFTGPLNSPLNGNNSYAFQRGLKSARWFIAQLTSYI